MLINTQHYSTAPPQVVVDLAGSPHQLELAEGQPMLVLDGQQVAHMSCQTDMITFYFQSPDATPVACAPAALWEAIAGRGVRASEQDAGYLLALVCALRLALERIERQCSLALDENALALPPYHEQFDPFIEDYLARCSGSIEDLEAIARVGNLPMERLLRWAAQHGRTWPVLPATTEPLQAFDVVLDREGVQATASKKEAADEPGSCASETSASPKEYFSWSEERVRALTEAFFKSSAHSIHAACIEIAQQFGWPAKKVEYKVHHLRLPEQKQKALQQPAATIPLLPSESSAQEESVKVLTPPVVDDTSLLDAPAAPLVALSEPIDLEIGPHVWTVRVDRSEPPQQWRLRYPYRSFPEHFKGKEVRYDGRLYRLEGVFTSQLNVGSLVHATAS